MEKRHFDVILTLDEKIIEVIDPQIDNVLPLRTMMIRTDEQVAASQQLIDLGADLLLPSSIGLLLLVKPAQDQAQGPLARRNGELQPAVLAGVEHQPRQQLSQLLAQMLHGSLTIKCPLSHKIPP